MGSGRGNQRRVQSSSASTPRQREITNNLRNILRDAELTQTFDVEKWNTNTGKMRGTAPVVLDLHGMTIENIDIVDADFAYVQINGICWRNIGLEGCDLRHSKFGECTFENFKMKKTNAKRSLFVDTTFENFQFDRIDLRYARFLKGSWQDFQIQHGRANSLELKEVNMNAGTLAAMDWNGAKILDSSGVDLDFDQVSLRKATIKGIKWQHSNFHDSSMAEAYVAHSEFKYSDFRDTDFHLIHLQDNIFDTSKLSKTKNWESLDKLEECSFIETSLPPNDRIAWPEVWSCDFSKTRIDRLDIPESAMQTQANIFPFVYPLMLETKLGDEEFIF